MLLKRIVLSFSSIRLSKITWLQHTDSPGQYSSPFCAAKGHQQSRPTQATGEFFPFFFSVFQFSVLTFSKFILLFKYVYVNYIELGVERSTLHGHLLKALPGNLFSKDYLKMLQKRNETMHQLSEFKGADVSWDFIAFCIPLLIHEFSFQKTKKITSEISSYVVRFHWFGSHGPWFQQLKLSLYYFLRFWNSRKSLHIAHIFNFTIYRSSECPNWRMVQNILPFQSDTKTRWHGPLKLWASRLLTSYF